MLKTWTELAEIQIYYLLMIGVVESFFTSCPSLVGIHGIGSLPLLLSNVAHQSANLTARAPNAAERNEGLQKTNDVSLSIGNLAWH